VTFAPNTPGRSGSRPDAPAPWPLLARLPHAGAQANAAAETSPFAEWDLPRSYQPAGREASPPPANARSLDALPRRQPASDRPATHASDPPHAFVHAYHLPEFDGGSAEARTVPPPARRDYLRIDAADARLGKPAVARPPHTALASRAYRWHEALAPHAGVAATAALILSATLLYWLTAGRTSPGSDRDNAFDQQNAWSSETSLDAQIGYDSGPPASVGDSYSVPPATAEIPHIAAAAPPTVTATAAPQTPPNVDPTDKPQPSAETTPPSTPAAAAVAPAQPSAPIPVESPETQEADPITPTPTSAPYPVTDYLSFDFGLPTEEPSTAAAPADVSAPTAAAGK
jgi:hypothetical protein